MEQVKTIEGEIDEIMERISSSGDAVVELHLVVGGSKEKCIAYADKAEALQNLQKKMQGLAQNNGCKHIRELGVKIEVTGLVKSQSSSKDLIVTAVKIVK